MASTQNLFKQYQLLRLPEIYKYLVGIFVYKFDNMQLPVIFSGFYAKARALHSHDTRTADNYRLINIKLEKQFEKSDLSKFDIEGRWYGIKTQAWYWYMYVWNGVYEIG